MAAKTTLPVKDIRHRLRLEEQARDELRQALLLSVRTLVRAAGDYDANPALAVKASNDIQDRIWGRARQQSDVTVVNINPAQAHFDALTAINAAKHALDLTANPLISMDDLTPRDKLSINHAQSSAPMIEGDLIPLPPKSADKSMT